MAVHKYNNSIHSFIQNTPHNILLGENEQNLTYEQRNRQRNMSYDKIADIFRTKDEKIRQDFKYQTFDPGTVAYEKMHELSKKKSRYKKIIISEDHDTYVIDSSNRKIHKCDLRKFP